ncbi:MAG: hypothetical protein K2P78_04030 [Gemmataceae bacterium]|nr:hypothetical protein [Gemmataceae bacterium]
MTRRPGLTTTEVLVALFVMALGAMAILTMFPLGMIQMGQALKDDRTSQAAATADGYMRWYWKNYVVETPLDANLAGAGSKFDAPPGWGTAPATEASYPVFVDPIGWNVRLDPSRSWAGYGPPANVQYFARVGMLTPPPGTPTTMGLAQSIRTCTLLDGLTYTPDGAAATPNGTVIERDARYNWLWVLQRAPNQPRSTATMTVVVFDKRGTYAAPETAFQFADPPSNTTPIVLTPGQTGLSLPFNSGVQKGGWIMDGTSTGSIRHAYFYRVVSAVESPTNPLLMDVELEKPVRRIDGSTAAYPATIMVFANATEVFERPSLGQ